MQSTATTAESQKRLERVARLTELAREAGVTERTFLWHFPTKEAVLFGDYETQLEWLAEALAQRPASEPLFDAILASVEAPAWAWSNPDWPRCVGGDLLSTR